MNIDEPDGHREANMTIKNYTSAEFVAVPTDFEIESHLHLRENFGMFEVNDIHLKQIKIISDAVKNSAVFSTLNNALLDPKCCMFFLYILSELGLILTKVDNPIRRENRDNYLAFAKRWNKERYTYVRGQDVLRMNFLIVNVVHLLNEEVVGQAMKAIEVIQKHEEEIRKAKKFKLD